VEVGGAELVAVVVVEVCSVTCPVVDDDMLHRESEDSELLRRERCMCAWRRRAL
jgi:hypothetical protein